MVVDDKDSYVSQVCIVGPIVGDEIWEMFSFMTMTLKFAINSSIFFLKIV